MLSFRRLAVTAAAVAAARRADRRPGSSGRHARVTGRRRALRPADRSTIDMVSPDARYGVPDENTPTFVTVPRTEVVEADDGFAWGDALLGGGAALALTAAPRRRRRRHPPASLGGPLTRRIKTLPNGLRNMTRSGASTAIENAMTLPTVTEIIRRPEATTRDTFVADLAPRKRAA